MKNNCIILFLIFFITIGCEFNETPIGQKETTLSKVLKDPLSKEFNKALVNAQKLNSLFIGNPSDSKSLRYKEFDSIDEFKIFIDENFENPEFVFNSLFELASLGQEIRYKYPEVSKFTSEDLDALVFEIVKSRENSYSESSTHFRIQGQCEDELDSSMQTCQDGALVGAAGCAILTPTLLGALGCGGVVYFGELVCIDDAERTYDICKSYEN